MTPQNEIAIVGMDCRYPGASSLGEYWDSILNLRQQFRKIPKNRLNLEDYYSPDENKVDFTYGQQAAVLNNYVFDRVKYRIAKSTFDQTDMTHWLALDVAAGALLDAGFVAGEGLDKTRTGVIFGNSLTGEFTRANIMRLRWPFVARVMEQAWEEMVPEGVDKQQFFSRLKQLYKAPFPKPDADTLAGGLANTIAGRICNYFDFNGGGFTVDGACASSLLAVANGAEALASERLDAVIVGGVDLSIDPFELIGFARTGALTRDQMHVFNSKSRGFIPGEGCGALLMMRKREAIRAGCKIYAVINGWGISSDGAGGMTRPDAKQQRLAISRAYQMAKYDISQVRYFEGHGTGTPTGDEQELEAIVGAMQLSAKPRQPAKVGSAKSLIGHTKAAAGVAGLIKAALSSYYNVIPPSIATEEPHNVIKNNRDWIDLSGDIEQLPDGEPLNCGISAMGFGGINAHITLGPNTHMDGPVADSKGFGKAALSSANAVCTDTELFVFSGETAEELLEELASFRLYVEQASISELIGFSNFTLHKASAGQKTSAKQKESTGKNASTRKYRATLWGKSSLSLLASIEQLEIAIKQDNPVFVFDKQFSFNNGSKNFSYGLLFPGQGAPLVKEPGIYKYLQDCQFELPALSSMEFVNTAISQPAIISSTLYGIDLCRALNLQPNTVVGHSLGELASLYWVGSLDHEQTLKLARKRGQIMADKGETDSGMLAINGNQEEIEQSIIDTRLVIACFNGESDFVIAGPNAQLTALELEADEKKWRVKRLPVSHAFHSPMMEPATKEFSSYLDSVSFSPFTTSYTSTISGDNCDTHTETKHQLAKQLQAPVLFWQAINAIKSEVSIWFEVGPGTTLSQLVSTMKGLEAYSLNIGGRTHKALLAMLSLEYVNGGQPNFLKLNAHRNIRTNDWDQSFHFLQSPCEYYASNKAPDISSSDDDDENQEESIVAASNDILTTTKQFISSKVGLPIEAIADTDHVLSDLHLNSLAVTELVARLAKHFKRDHKSFSTAAILGNTDGSVKAIADLLEHSAVRDSNHDSDLPNLALSPKPILAYKEVNQAVARKPMVSHSDENDWHFHKIDETPELASLINAISEWESRCRLGRLSWFVCPQKLAFTSEADAAKTLASITQVLQIASESIVVLDCSHEQELKPIWKTAQLEYPQCSITYISLSPLLLPKISPEVVEVILEHTSLGRDWREINIDANGNATTPYWQPYFPDVPESKHCPLQKGDVLLVTGGSGGIGFASARYLAEKTGVTLLLMGRRDRQKDKPLDERLTALENSGINYRYLSFDLNDSQGLSSALDEVSQTLGPITGVLHAAGVNVPKKLTELKYSDFYNTQQAKVAGLDNLLNILSDIKVLISYGSIIAESGMAGNADYAWANKRLTQLTGQYQINNPKCRCKVIEWSVWDEIGMGAELGNNEYLHTMGVDTLPVSDALEKLWQSLCQAPENNNDINMLISGRYRLLKTINFGKRRPLNNRFIEVVREYQPHVEIVADAVLSSKTDNYFEHHIYRGQKILPTVLAMESFAQAVAALTDKPIIKVETLDIHHPVLLDDSGERKVRVHAVRTGQNTFWVALLSDANSFESCCYEANVRVGEKTVSKENILIEESTSLIDCNEDFYDPLLFHTGPFRRISELTKVNAEGAYAKAHYGSNFEWYSAPHSNHIFLGDPGLTDAMLHVHQAAVPHQSLLPSNISSMEFFEGEFIAPFSLTSKQKLKSKDELLVTTCLYNAHGKLLQRIDGLLLSRVKGADFAGPWHPAFAQAIITHRLMEHENSFKENISKNWEMDFAQIQVNELNQDILRRWKAGQLSVVDFNNVVNQVWPEIIASKVRLTEEGWLLATLTGEAGFQSKCDTETIKINILPINASECVIAKVRSKGEAVCL